MQSLADKGMPVQVVDIAAGHGRYVLDALAASPVAPQSILLRDKLGLRLVSPGACLR